MNTGDIRRLLGGYATGTLTPEEQKTLFDAALHDQDLFEELAREQALKDTLDDAGVRRELRDALEPAASWRERFRPWLRWRIPLAAAGALAAAAITIIAITHVGPRLEQRAGTPTVHQEIAQSRLPSAAPPPALESPGEQPRLSQPAPRSRASSAASPVQPPPAALPKPAPAVTADSLAPQQDTSAAPSEPAASSRMAKGVAQGFTSGVAGGVVGGVPTGLLISPSAPPLPALELHYSFNPQLVVEATGDSVLYIFDRDQNGQWRAVTPGGLSLKAHTSTTAPATPAKGDALLVLSHTPLPQLAQTGPALTAALDKLRAPNAQPAAVLITPVTVP